MRLEEWQKWLDSQFVEPEAVEAVAQPADEVTVEPAAPPERSPAALAQPYPSPAPADSQPDVQTANASQPEITAGEAPLPPPIAATAAHTFEAVTDDVEVPSIESYLPFLRARAVEQTEVQQPAAAETQSHEAEAEETAPVVAKASQPMAEPEPAAAVEPAAPPAEVPEPPAPVRRFAPASQRSRHGRRAHGERAAVPMAAEEVWSLVPRHMRTLVAMGGDEVAQNSYRRSFKESRIELIQRLLDPTLSLEETARLLNVCPTTVRRYTNRGLLQHQRTPGDQRRFKLSDVLAFLESQSQG